MLAYRLFAFVAGLALASCALLPGTDVEVARSALKIHCVETLQDSGYSTPRWIEEGCSDYYSNKLSDYQVLNKYESGNFSDLYFLLSAVMLYCFERNKEAGVLGFENCGKRPPLRNNDRHRFDDVPDYDEEYPDYEFEDRGWTWYE